MLSVSELIVVLGKIVVVQNYTRCSGFPAEVEASSDALSAGQVLGIGDISDELVLRPSVLGRCRRRQKEEPGHSPEQLLHFDVFSDIN